ncbi:LysR family transcriptional regulator [Sporomusa sp. GT1]|uniref:LysR family transcriptional regulator n=1 Tax=Sporomusa sp. GT1 TaxID=1534747 RepID=UPI001665FEF1|nr:LysR family transcriptional regulator [Sporomusa sp. GT1]
MEIVNVHAFLAVVNHGNFSKAAESLYVAQSVLTKRIQSLEKELQRLLFERQRGRRVVELTPSGMEFVPIARRFAAAWQDTRNFATGIAMD